MKEKFKALTDRILSHDRLTVIHDLLFTAAVLLLACLACILLRLTDDGDTYVSMIFMLAVVVIARYTDGYLYGIAASLASLISPAVLGLMMDGNTMIPMLIATVCLPLSVVVVNWAVKRGEAYIAQK